MDDFGQRVKSARIGRGWSQEHLASQIGTTQSTIERIENGGSLRSRFRHEAAAALGLASPGSPTVVSEGYRPPPELLGPRDFPIYAAVEGGAGAMVVSNDVIELVQRPWFMRDVPGYGVIVVGESMDPAFKPGDIAIVNPRLPVIRGKNAIFVAGEDKGEFNASIKEYQGQSTTAWRVRQHNPPTGQKHDIDLPKKDWSKALRVVGKYEG